MKNKIKKSIIVIIALHHFWFRARIDVELLQKESRSPNEQRVLRKIGKKNRYTREVVVWFF